jgi:hypothetical protein
MLAEMFAAKMAGAGAATTNNSTVANIVTDATRVVIFVMLCKSTHTTTSQSSPSEGTKKLTEELTEGSKKLSEGGKGCTVLSISTIETLIV